MAMSSSSVNDHQVRIELRVQRSSLDGRESFWKKRSADETEYGRDWMMVDNPCNLMGDYDIVGTLGGGLHLIDIFLEKQNTYFSTNLANCN